MREGGVNIWFNSRWFMETRENQKYFEESNRRLLAFTDFENDNGIELCVAIAVYSVR